MPEVGGLLTAFSAASIATTWDETFVCSTWICTIGDRLSYSGLKSITTLSDSQEIPCYEVVVGKYQGSESEEKAVMHRDESVLCLN